MSSYASVAATKVRFIGGGGGGGFLDREGGGGGGAFLFSGTLFNAVALGRRDATLPCDVAGELDLAP